MRTLYLLRHAKSSWDAPGLNDRDRPLNDRGERAARKIAAYLRAEELHPELVLCSSARRTRDTLALVLPALGDAVIEIEPALYGAEVPDILRCLRAVDDGAGSVMVIGHNPGLQDLALGLAGSGDDVALAQLRTKYPTAALATLDVPTTWSELHLGEAHLSSIVLPRELPD